MASRVEEGCGGAIKRSKVVSRSSFGDLAHELFDEILKRLSLKDLHRCNCVSKGWLNQISNPHFPPFYVQYQTTLNDNASPPFALFYQFDVRPPKAVGAIPNSSEIGIAFGSQSPIFYESSGFRLNYLPHPNPSSSSSKEGVIGDHLRLLAVSNGLLLCSTSLVFHKLYYVCNPLTMHWVQLPPPPTCPKHVGVGFITRIDNADLRKCSYRVVRICMDGSVMQPESMELEIFSSDTGAWTHSRISCLHEPLFGHAVDCNGILYWGFGSTFLRIDPYDLSVPHRIIQAPGENHKRNEKDAHGVCKGHLRFAQNVENRIIIWELGDNFKWQVVHKIRLPMHSRHFPFALVAFHATAGDRLYFSLKNGITLKLRDTQQNIIICNPKPINSGASYLLLHLVFHFELPWWPTAVPLLPHSVI